MITDLRTDWLAQRAASYPERAALTDGERTLSYRELLGAASTVAAGLAGEGAGPGDLVAIDLPAGIEHVVGFHGALLAGGFVQSLRPGEPTAEREAALAAGRPEATLGPGVITASAAAPPAGMAPPQAAVAADPSRRSLADPLSRVLTSGTGGHRRAIDLSYGNHLWNAVASALNLGVDPADVWLCCIPLNHVAGVTVLVRSLLQGTTALIHEGFDADRVAAALDAGEATVVSIVPTQLRRLLAAGAPLDRPRVLLVGGGPLAPDLLEQATANGARIVQTYGLTEACSQVCTLAPEDAPARSGSVGRPLLGVEVRLVEDEICVRGPTVAAGCADADGWLHTGDLGRLDTDGYLWVEGRRDDLIITGGENVRPEEVEAVLLRHPAVADAAVVGRPDPEWGSAVTAVIVSADGAEPDDVGLREHCRATLAPFKVPKRFESVAELPRTHSGKVIRERLR